MVAGAPAAGHMRVIAALLPVLRLARAAAPQNPALLDGAEGAKHSSQIAALQEAQLALPPPEHALGKEGQLVPAEPKYGLLPSKGMNRRVPHGEIFPMRPAETGPGDQLMLNGVDADDQVSMADIFEMFAKHRLDPEYWTYTRLAEHFLTREDWVRALLQYNMAPTFVKVRRQQCAGQAARPLAWRDPPEGSLERGRRSLCPSGEPSAACPPPLPHIYLSTHTHPSRMIHWRCSVRSSRGISTACMTSSGGPRTRRTDARRSGCSCERRGPRRQR